MLSGERAAVEGEEVEDALVAIKRNGIALKGNIHTYVNRFAVCKSDNVRLRLVLAEVYYLHEVCQPAVTHTTALYSKCAHAQQA